jgi:ribosomal protein S18 acetylase RimI-like enzyme
VLQEDVSQANRSLPPGFGLIPVRTTYLEMWSRPETEPIPAPPGCAVKRWEKPDTKAYRDLFSAVGGEWGWSGRLVLKDEEVQAVILAENCEIYRLFFGGKVAGFVELDRSVPGPNGPRRGGQAEIAYFGLLPGFIGRGLGKFLLDWTIRRAWAGETTRVWLHTCQHDHAGALAVYRKAGFNVYDEQVEMQPYPEAFIRKFRTQGG